MFEITKSKAEVNITLLKQIAHNYRANPSLKAYGEACEVAIECLKKQIPISPSVQEIKLKNGNTRHIHRCSCGCVLSVRKKNNFCDCGQKIDWKGVL